MIKMFKYEFKKNIKITIIISVIMLAITLLILGNYSFVRSQAYSFNKIPNWIIEKYEVYVDTGDRLYYPTSTPLAIFVTYGVILSFFYAIYEFGFKTKKVEVDAMYSLPIKRRDLYLAKFLNGLTQTLIPIMISYIITVIYIALSYNLYNMWGFLLYVPIFILFISLLYSVYAFGFTRGNNIADGVFTIIFISILPAMLYLYNGFTKIIDLEPALNQGWETILGPIISVTTVVEEMIIQTVDRTNFFIQVGSYFNILISLACLVLFIVLASKEKAEDAEERTNSWFAYNLFIPLYTYIFISILPDILLVTIFIACAYFMYVYKNKSFKISTVEIIILLSVAVLGLLTQAYIESIQIPVINPYPVSTLIYTPFI